MINLVVEIGTSHAKIGYAGESRPRISTESLLIEPPENPKQYSLEQDELFLHRHTRQLAYNLDLHRIDSNIHDIFQYSWQSEEKQLGLNSCRIKTDNYCKFLGELIAEVREGSPSDCSLLLVQSPNMKKHELAPVREAICQYLFNQLNTNSVYFLKSTVSNCLAQGSPNGIVIDSGQNYTSIARVQDAYQESVVSLNLGGNLTSALIQEQIIREGLGGSYQFEVDNLRKKLIKARQFKDIKERLSKETHEIQSQRVVEVELPDKQKILIDKDLIADPLTRVKQFKEQNDFVLPSNYRGLSQIVAEYLEDSKDKFKESLSKYITFAGGNFMFRDLLDRAESSIRKSAAVKGIDDVEFIQNNHKLFSSWIGGSIVGSLSSFSPYWVSNREWRENGAGIVSKKCP